MPKLSTLLVTVALLAGCATGTAGYRDIRIAGFHSDEPERCRPTDVALDDRAVAAYFTRAREVSFRTLHDHYDWAPCHVAGALKASGKSCEWTIQAGGIGTVLCGKQVHYYVCDGCDDLFPRQ